MEFTPELIRALLEVHAQFNAVFNNYTDIKNAQLWVYVLCIGFVLFPVYSFNG